MSLNFINIRSKEIVFAESEPKIAALWSSGDRGPNSKFGQDFGWRLALEVELELRRIKRDSETIQRIANNMHKSYDEITEIDILKYISDRTSKDKAPVPTLEDYDDAYNAEIRELELDHSSKAQVKEAVKEELSFDTRLEEARIEAAELGIDITNIYDHLGLIRGAITRFKNKNK